MLQDTRQALFDVLPQRIHQCPITAIEGYKNVEGCVRGSTVGTAACGCFSDTHKK